MPSKMKEISEVQGINDKNYERRIEGKLSLSPFYFTLKLGMTFFMGYVGLGFKSFDLL